MRAIGRITTLGLLAGMVAVANLGWKSRHDVRRYLKMRSM
jgi:hypothetical protein